ncbi:MAG: NADPH:quinone reductase [Gudongella sp.]|jgi:NADPH:quinone reductase-like Zn-dependent oxidoreductase|nr:NADPH:quinone reductase [Gudongella sp.]
MKAIVMSSFGDPEVLQIKEINEPIPGVNEVRVRLHAAGVNPNEAYIRSGNYSFGVPDLPFTPGFDGAGVVDAVGEGVTHVKVGDRVFVAAMLAKKNTGTYAQKVVCEADAVHLLADNVSFEQGASLGIPAMAAYRALFHRAKLKASEVVLIHGASGGVGTLAVQMAKAIGAVVIGTASSDEGKAMVKDAGADFATDHLREDNFDEILKITDGKGPDVIIEFLANHNLENDMKIISQYGRIVIVGNRGSIEITPRHAMGKEADILGMALWNAPPKEYKESLYGISAFLKSGVVVPIVGDKFKLEEAYKTHELILTKKGHGKMVLLID